MDKSLEILSEIIIHSKYARYLPELQRRETWEEIINRNMEMHIKKFPDLSEQIKNIYNNFVLTKKILPSMRSLQFAGRAIELNNSRIYNCAFLPIDNIRSFSETMFLLLGGTGVGYSVQHHHIEKLPQIRKPNYNRKKRYVVQDSIIGWADAVKTLMKSYTGELTSHIEFDLTDIRPKGSLLITAGGKAPGPEPLRIALIKIEAILREKQDESNLSDIECHDIQCHIADAVLAGGIRRAAMISLFDLNSDEMLSCKAGNWWEQNPQRGRANNSAVILRHRITQDVFNSLFERIEASQSGEPGIYFTNDKDWGTNPCVEIALRPYQFCNLVELNMSNIESQEDFNNRCKAAAFLGTLQASYTDFHYLRDIWKRNTEKDALLGISMTGIASKSNLKLDFIQSSEIIKQVNKSLSKIININSSARNTCVKPAGTTSLVLGTSSGIHAWHDDYYLRSVRINKNEALYTYLSLYCDKLLEDDVTSPNTTAVIRIPQKAPDDAITRNESVLDLLERVKYISNTWIKNGHNKGENKHNISCTVNIKDNEWNIVRDWMWENKDCYNGISVLPYHGGTYKQMPFETISKNEFNERYQNIIDLDLRKVVEIIDNTDLTGELACAGGNCEIK